MGRVYAGGVAERRALTVRRAPAPLAPYVSRMPSWRRVADWKRTITLVHLGDLDLPAGWATPADRLGDRFPRLAAAVTAARFARVEEPGARVLRSRGVPLYEVGSHRGSSGFFLADDAGGERDTVDLDAGALAAGIFPADDDAAFDDVVDALLRIHTEGLLTERAVILAAAAPALGPAAPLTADELAEAGIAEALDPADLPHAPDATVDAVAAALASPPAPDPMPPEVRRAYIRKAGGIGVLAVVVGLVGLATSPLLTVFASPVVVLCALLVTIHALALRGHRVR